MASEEFITMKSQVCRNKVSLLRDHIGRQDFQKVAKEHFEGFMDCLHKAVFS